MGAYGQIYYDGFIQIDVTRKYRMTTSFVVHGVAQTTYVGFGCYDANKTSLGNIYMHAVGNGNPLVAGGTVQTVSNVFTGTIGPGPIYGYHAGFPDGTVFVRPLAFLNHAGGAPTGISDITALYLEDITSEANAGSAASVASSAAAQASSSAASAQTFANLSANLSGGSMGPNSIFADYPAGLTIPPGWNSWNGSGSRTYGNGLPHSPGSSVEGSPWGFYQISASAAQEAGIYQDIPGGSGHYVVSATVKVLDGSGFSGAGVLIYGLDGNGAVVSSGTINFATDPDIAETVWGRSRGADYGINYKWSKLIPIPGSAVRTIRVYAMTNWTGFDTQTGARSLAWLRCSIKPASSAEVKTGKIEAMDARITSVESASASATAAVATRATNLEARAGSLEARTGITETAIADLQSGQASARLVLSAVTGGGVAQISLVSNTNGGAAVEIVGNVSISGQKLQDGTVGAGKLTVGELSAITANLGTVTAGVVRSADGLTEFNLNTGRQKFVTGGYRLVQGGNLGPNANMVLWYGPTSVAEGQETIANSAFALATDGKIYQGSAQINAAGKTAQTVGVGVSVTRVLGVGETVSLEASVGVTGATSSGTLTCQIQVDGVVARESAGAYIGPNEPAAAYIPSTTYTNNTGVRRAFTFRVLPNSTYGGTTNPALSWLTVG